MTKKKKVLARIFIIIGIILLLGALGITVYNIVCAKNAEKSSRSMTDELWEGIQCSPVYILNQRLKEAGQLDDYIPDYILNPDMDMPEIQVGDYMAIAMIEIPVLELKLPVLSEWDYSRLLVAPCRYVGSAYKNDLVIAAHNYPAHFGNLKYLQHGDEVILTDMDGNEFHYTVDAIDILEPTSIEEMINNDWDLTLFTCTIGGRARVTVRLDRADEQ